MMKWLPFALLLTMLVGTTRAQILINEYSCSNITTVLDAYNQRNDWMELYNAGGAPVNLTGYFLSDDKNDLTKWPIPTATPINAGARKMVYFSGRDVVHAPTGQIHTSFKLRQTMGEWIILSDPGGNVVDSIKLRITQRNHSRGRIIDGSPTWGIFTAPTVNASNNAQITYTGYTPKVVFSVNAGFYTATQNITLSCPDPNTIIRYTVNGANPNPASPVYAGPITVAATAAVRAIAYNNDPLILPSMIETNTYFINESSNYKVISVCGSFTTAAAAAGGGGTNLFNGGQAIFSSFEYFTNTGTQILEMEGGRASRHGNDSWAYPQKGIDFEAMDESGDKSVFSYPLFGTSLRDTFDRIMMKAGGSDNYAGGPNNSAHLRDVFAQTLSEKYNLEMDFRRYNPVLMFVNGAYWGVYDMREPVNQDYFEYYYGKKKEKIDHLSYWGGLQIRLGSDTGWVNLYNYIMNNNMAVQANYEHVKQFLNVNSFSQYFIINSYLVNHDWLNWNTMWWRGRGNNNPIKWRYVLWDMDAITALNNPNYTGIPTTSANADPCQPTSLFQNNATIKHTDMLTRLLQNPEFSKTYKDNWVMMMGGPLECTKLLAHYDSVVNILSPEMSRQATRWGGTMGGWQANVAAMRTFLLTRCANVTGKLDTCLDLQMGTLKLNVNPPGKGTIALDGDVKAPYVWSRLLRADTTYNLKATSTGGPYWVFDYWQKVEPTNTISPSINDDYIQYGFRKNDSVIAHFKYFNFDSLDVTFDVNPPGTGNITLNGDYIWAYPFTRTLDRRYAYNILATAAPSYKFIGWTKNNPTTTITPPNNKSASFTYDAKETIVANFEFVPPPPPPPPLPGLNADTYGVFVPDAFSPNADGKNDVFNIRLGADATGMDIVIYDRWGNQVFHSNSILNGWDGMYNSKVAEVGVYHYLLQVKFRDGKTKQLTGDISLIR